MKKGDVVRGVVTKIKSTHFIVDLENEYHGIVHVSAVSDYFVSNLSLMFKVEGEYNFLILDVDNITKRVKLDWKSIHPRFQKNPFKYKIEETEKGFKNILKNTKKEVEND